MGEEPPADLPPRMKEDLVRCESCGKQKPASEYPPGLKMHDVCIRCLGGIRQCPHCRHYRPLKEYEEGSDICVHCLHPKHFEPTCMCTACRVQKCPNKKKEGAGTAVPP